MGKRQDELDDYSKEIDRKIAELEEQAEIDRAEAETASKLASRGVQYGNSGFFRGGNTKELEALSENLDGGELPESPAIPDASPNNEVDSVTPIWNASDQSTFGTLSGVVNDPNAAMLEDKMNPSALV